MKGLGRGEGGVKSKILKNIALGVKMHVFWYTKFIFESILTPFDKVFSLLSVPQSKMLKIL